MQCGGGTTPRGVVANAGALGGREFEVLGGVAGGGDPLAAGRERTGG